MTSLEVLKQYWGYDSFRPLQSEIIDSVCSGCDTLALLPTGAGKSICFQVPGLMKEGVCLVVSPLISLMRDQVENLRKRGITAEYLHSGLFPYEVELVLNKSIFGKVKFLYVSPERLHSAMFLEHFKQMKVAYIVVDEAHCISQWGYDFRPSYLDIVKIRSLQPRVPVVALTATATPRVMEDICDKLSLKGCKIFQGSFSRPNISYMVFHEEDKLGRLLRIVKKVQGAAIVYVRNRRLTQDVAEYLKHSGFNAVAYHAGLKSDERSLRQQLWMNGQVPIVVATNAFGMGIDKADVRLVVHLDIPDAPESYFQETGRAGRDGKRSYAVLLYNKSDIEQLNNSIGQNYPEISFIRNVYRAVGNYYQVPIGSGNGLQFDFVPDDICNAYGFDFIKFYSALRFLSKEGLLSIPEQDTSVSQLHIPIDKDTLWRFEQDHQRYGDLIKQILRMYGGLFGDFVQISEREIAKRRMVDRETVVKELEKLHSLKVVVYKPKRDGLQIIFTSPRIDDASLYISEENYKALKESAVLRKDAMLQYVEGNFDCRTKFLLHYFGSDEGEVCGQCDICVQRKRTPQEKQRVFDAIETAVLTKLRECPMTIQQLLSEVPNYAEKDVIEVTRMLVDLRKIRIDAMWKLSAD